MKQTLSGLPEKNEKVILTEQKMCSGCGNTTFNLTGSVTENELTATCLNCGTEEKLQKSTNLYWESMA